MLTQPPGCEALRSLVGLIHAENDLYRRKHTGDERLSNEGQSYQDRSGIREAVSISRKAKRRWRIELVVGRFNDDPLSARP
jgi:hypothetical protein